ncbi:MAG: DinB family protein [Tepidiformaceae bacterium]
MTPTHAAALQVARESFAMLRTAVDGLPDAAADWIPAPGTNSVAVLTAHCVTGARFFYAVSSGTKGSLTGYRAGERSASFASRTAKIPDLLVLIDSFQPELEAILAKGDAASLEARTSWPTEDPGEPERSGLDWLFRATGHLREHVGQAQLNRDLWNAHVANAS